MRRARQGVGPRGHGAQPARRPQRRRGTVRRMREAGGRRGAHRPRVLIRAVSESRRSRQRVAQTAQPLVWLRKQARTLDEAMPLAELLSKTEYLPESDRKTLARAHAVAADAHVGQFRLTGEP